MSNFAMLIVFFSPFFVFAEGLVPKEVQKLSSQFNQTMMICPDKIWPNYTWKGLKVALVYPKKGHSWVWDASTNSTQKVDNKTLPPSVVGSIYELFEMDGQKALSLNMENDNEEIFQFGVHEFFHYYGQEEWERGEDIGGRGTPYPIVWQPRLYRRMIFDNIKRYLESRNPTELGQARYWYDKWTQEFPDEKKSSTDGFEGTAEFVETMAEAIDQVGCSASDASYRSEVVKKINSDFGFSVSGQHFGLDAEGYEIGGVAALNLRFENNNLNDWTTRMTKGESPLYVLLEKVSPIVEKAPKELNNNFIAAAKRINTEYGALLDSDIANWTNKSYIRVPAPGGWLQSNLMPKFFAQSTQLGMTLYPLFTTHKYNSPDGLSKLELKTNTVLFNYFIPECPSMVSFALVAAGQVQYASGMANISSNFVQGKIAGRMISDGQGYQYLCAE